MLDVVVIGGGPIGSRVAFQMSAKGYRVAVLEKRTAIGEKPCCTGIISQECANLYNIPSEIIFRRVNSARIFSPSGNLIRVYRPEPQACIVDRPALDRFLASQAQNHGAEYYLNCRAENLMVSPEKVVIDVIDHGLPRRFESRVVVLATGFNAAIVNRLGSGQPAYQVAGVQTEVQVKSLDEVEVFFSRQLAPGFFAWLVPTSQGRALAGLMTRQSPGNHLRSWISKLESRGVIIPEERQVRFAGIPLKPLSRTFGQRLLVVGDAAGQVKPTTGGGIYFGLICADIASETLHKALQKDDLSLRNLEAYEKSWRRRLGRELQREYFARKIYMLLSDKQLDRLFGILRSTGLVESLLQDESVSFDWHGGLMLKVLRSGLLTQSHRLWRAPLNLVHR